jgi:hypothetical protein
MIYIKMSIKKFCFAFFEFISLLFKAKISVLYSEKI